MDEKTTLVSSLKDLLGIPQEESAFDSQLLGYLVSAIFKLKEIGLTINPFTTDVNITYEDVFGYEEPVKSQIVMYLYYKTKQLFDPPTNGSVTQSLNNEILEAEWRLNAWVDPPGSFG